VSDPLGNFHKDSLNTLINKMRRQSDDGNGRYRALRAELNRRLAVKQIQAAKSQIITAWLQLAAVVVAAIAVVATLAAPYLSHLLGISN
jgi:hypothetical protein